jgi:hypothetical protein
VPAERKPLVLPPLRFVFGADGGCAFAVEQPTAHALIAEVAASVAAAGFRKIVIVNCEPVERGALRGRRADLRVIPGAAHVHHPPERARLDFHPQRSTSRGKLQTLLTSLYGAAPEPAPEAPPDANRHLGDRVGDARWQAGPARLRRPDPRAPPSLAAAAERVAKLLSDIHETRARSRALITPA